MRRAARLAATVGLLVLVVAFLALLLTPFSQPRAHFCLLTPSPGHLLGEPRSEYLTQDVAAIEAVAETLSQRGAARRAVRLENLQSLEELQTLSADVNRVIEKSSDVVILYVTTAAILEAGTPMLLCGSFDARQAEAGRYPLRSFLEQISGCRAAVKLVILDVGREDYDPRLGTLANQFPRLLREEVAQTKDPTLWVLSANAERERSQVLRACERSAFGYFVTRGLLGAADLNADAHLDLDEFQRYVSSRVSVTVSAASQGMSSQTPELLWGGGGTPVPAAATRLVRLGKSVVEPESQQLRASIDAAVETTRLATFRKVAVPPTPVLQRVIRRAPPPSTATNATSAETTTPQEPASVGAENESAAPASGPAADTGESDKATNAATTPDGAGSTPATSTPASPNDPVAKPSASASEVAAAKPAADAEATGTDTPKSDGESQTKASEPATNRRFAELLVAAWQLRDAFESEARIAEPLFAPAPQLWREINQRLLRYDQRFRAGSIDAEQALADDLEDLVVALRQFAAGEPIISGRGGTAVAQLARLQVQPGPQADEVCSLALAQQLGATSDNNWSVEMQAAATTLADLLQGGNEAAFAAWTADKLPSGYERFSELRWTQQLLAAPHLPWSERLLTLRVRATGERVAARATNGLPWVRERLVSADQQRIQGERAVWDRIGADWQAHARQALETAEQAYLAAESDLELIRTLHIQATDLASQMPAYVHWRHAAGPDTQVGVPSYELLEATLSDLLRVWTLLEQPDPTQLSEVRRLADQLASHRKQLEAGLHDLAIEELVRAPGEPKRIENLLATTLPRGEQRRQLLEFAAVAEARRLTRLEFPEPADTPPTAPTATYHDWQRWLNQARLETRLCELAITRPAELKPEEDLAHAAFAQLSTAVRNLEQATNRSDVTTAGPSALMEIGTALGDFYRHLPQSIQRRVIAASDLSDPATRETHRRELQGAQRACWFVDGRDAQTLAALDLSNTLAQASHFDWLVWQRDRALAARHDAPAEEVAHLTNAASAYRKLALSIAGQPAVADDVPALVTLAGPTSGSLISEPQVVVPITLENVGSRDAKIWLILAHDPQVLEVDVEAGPPIYRLSETAVAANSERPSQASYPYRPDLAGVTPSLSLAGGQSSFARLLVRRKNTSPAPTRIVVKALAVAADNSAVTYIRHSVEMDVPGTDAVALRVTGTPGTWNETESKLSLFPFANGVTPFQLALANPGSQAIQADVQWLTSEKLAGISVPSGSLSPVEAERLLSRLAPTSVVIAGFPATLPADSLTPIPFPKPGPPAPLAPDAAAASPAAATGETPADDSAKETRLPADLLVVITDRESRRQTFRLVEIRPQRPRRYLRPQIGYDPQRERIEIVVKPTDASLLPAAPTTVQVRATGATLNGDPIDVEGSIDPEHPEFRSTIAVPAGRDRIVTLELSIDGYPRAFTYEVPCWATATNIPEKSDLLRVQITSLPQGQSYKAPAGPIPVNIQVDAPLGAFENVADMVRVGIDLNRDRELIEDPLIVLRSDRQVSLFLDHTTPEGSLAVRTVVEDFRVTVPPPPLRSARANMIAQLSVSGRSSWSDPIEVVFDGLPPRVFQPRLAPGSDVPQGTKELEASFLASDDELSLVQRVEAALDLLGTGSFPPDAKPTLAVANGATGTWDIKLPAAELTPGAYRLLARAVDAVGNEGDYTSVTFRVVPPTPAPADGSSEIRGRVLYRQEPLANADVTLQAADGTEIPPTTTDGEGSFLFAKVPPGKYKLSARAVIHNRPRIGDLECEVPAPPATAKPVEVQLK